ncbi:glycosyltransferase [Roseomonas sp. KE0001]|uniref:glycosyltransferase n=1 Tax=Roseomonas sp. KE0001 TaxID=2479201 RepID=UPI0018DFBC9C|nr:glycosyltransferase [Roseomonas sp. KE0001]MBI0434614.1 glycosyltransferase [Roseomonas sp. KE0001]
MTDVAVLLATYNGAAHLEAQLASIAAQQPVDWRLLWRDDASRDATPELLRSFAEGEGAGRVTRITGPQGRAGAAGSFMALLAAAPEAGAYAFCDQDDVWLPGKLARALRRLEEVPPGQPALYCARQRLVDAALRPIGLSPVPPKPPAFRNALVQNIVTGCTAVLNPAARRLMLAAPAVPPGSLHDWWSYLMVTGAGGTVIFDPEPALLYRQHGGNAVGSPASAGRRAVAALQRGARAFLTLFQAHLAALDRARPLLTPDSRVLLDLLRPLPELSPLARCRRLRRAGLYRQGRLEDLMLRLWFLLEAPAALPPGRASG